jgi:hypothetical protein
MAMSIECWGTAIPQGQWWGLLDQAERHTMYKTPKLGILLYWHASRAQPDGLNCELRAVNEQCEPDVIESVAHM